MADVVGMYRRYGVTLRPAADSSGWATVQCFTGTHDDRRPSARVHLTSGGFKCFGCGASGGALAALELLGVGDPAERVQVAVDYGILDKPIRPRPRPAATTPAPPRATSSNTPQRVDYDRLPQTAGATRERAWTYVDATGEPVGRIRRFDLPDGEKRIWQERPDGASGWLTGLAGRTLPLYRLDQVLEHAANRFPIVVVEGEKACDALDRLGLFATTSPGGAGKWRDGHTLALTGATVSVIADSDLAGRLHAADVVAGCLAAGIRVRMPLDLFELSNSGDDVVDWLSNVAAAARTVDPELPAGELRHRLRRKLDYELARCLPADARTLQLFVERARHLHDPTGTTLATCDSCGHERPHRVSHGVAFCPCGSHQAAP